MVGVESVARKAVVERRDRIRRRGESISYAVDGVEYEIDLKDEHPREFRDALDYCIAHSMRVRLDLDLPDLLDLAGAVHSPMHATFTALML
ncbi:hypothetical protein EEB14_36710 [Rhodococcus sp. WS4]|nr:hypothetical protein EEB14_36710 [Rhodococcus sp. WS4]